jgi:3-phenylpropionate/trans-cinnamate dioxygenase ferredoxin subunit
VFDYVVECPRHGSEFDLQTGSPLSLPATSPVPTYRVSVEDGMVYLNLED